METNLEDIEVKGDDVTVNFFEDDNLEVEAKKKPSEKQKSSDDKDDKDDKDDEKKDDKAEDKKDDKKDDKKEDLDDIDFFGTGDDEDDNPDDKKDDKKDNLDDDKGDEDDTDDEPSSVSTLNHLKDAGIIEFELDEDEELTEERAAELIEDSIEETIEKSIEDKLKSLPKAIKDLNKFVLNGGDPAQFLSSMVKTQTSKIKKGIDLKEEKNQELVVRELLKAEGYEEEYIKTQIDFLKDSKNLESAAEARYKKWETDFDNEQQTLATKQASQKQANKKAIRDNKKALTATLSKDKSIDGIIFDKKEIKELPDYMYEPAYRLPNGREVTTMEKDLMEAMKDQSKMALMAKILKSDFDFESFKEDASEEVSSEVRKNLRRDKKKGSRKARVPGKPKELADYFD